MRTLERIFKALADRNRLRILKMLEVKPMCVCEITAVLGIAQPSVSRHLCILRDAGLLRDEKDGVWTNYSLARGGDGMIDALLLQMRKWGNADPVVLRDRRKAGMSNREAICGRPACSRSAE
ncbi:MAG: metalloregulator ArsR/SmtB family transcription factor [bacterium]|nr:metalloregulator ArsR/SmtB family transcription factor [bacterium]